ncbi:MAG: XRE family transcriptional regulator [Chitinophagaceae bacterium]|nr:MAG: XRE family transcriptional regulator [Chitinophagaceae bacterium]
MKKERSLFSKNLDFLMTNAGMQNRKLAEATRVQVQSVSNWRIGRNDPEPETLNIIAKMFGISSSDLKKKDLSQSGFATVELGDSLRKIDVKVDVLLEAISMVLGEQQKKVPRLIEEDLKALVNKRLNDDDKEGIVV